MASYLKFLGHTTPEGPPSIIYQHNNEQFMFNCREGTQRLAVEDKAKLAKLNSIYFTRLEWECTGGMPGMLLTLSDSGVQNMNLYGGKNLTHLMASTRFFVYRTTTTVHTHEYEEGSPDFLFRQTLNEPQHKSLKVTPVIVLPSMHHNKSQQPSSSSSDYSPSDNPYSVSKSSADLNTSTAEDKAHLKQVVSFMFSNQEQANGEQKNQSNNNSAGEHAMNAPCVPRQHPLANITPKSSKEAGRPASEASEAIVEIKPKVGQMKPQAVVTPIESNASGKQRSTNMMELYAKDLPRTTPHRSAISYICRTPATRGKFDKQEAVKLGVPVGPLFGKLQRGETVTLDNGTVVTHLQVCEKSTPGSVFIVVDCPTRFYIDGLVTSPKFNDYQTQTNTQNVPKVIIHLLGRDVLDDVKYRQWMNSFSPETEHIISSEDVCSQSNLFRSHAISQYKLSKLDPVIFKIPEYNNNPMVTFDKYNDLPPKVSPLVNKSVYNLQETRKMKFNGPQLDQTLPFDINRPLDEPKMTTFDENTEFQTAIQKAKDASSQVDLGEPFAGDDVQVVTLGTGSSIPSKYRNVSATLIKIPKFGSVLLDAGEGTYGQMLRYFGCDKISKELDELRCIFVSHLHADHHLGVFQLLTKRRQLWADKKRSSPDPQLLPLYLIGPYEYQRWMKEYNDVEHVGASSRLRFIRADLISNGKKLKLQSRAKTNVNSLQKLLGLSNIEAVEVDHCRFAYGLSLVHETGWKLVYSGDTRPCDRLIKAGQDATLLIHEATLEDDMKAEAIIKKHSTTAEAVEVGQKMNARYTLLNHFSQRYAKVPTLSEDQANVCLSFDMMSVFVKQIPLLPKFNRVIQLIFKGDEEEDEKDTNGTEGTQIKADKSRRDKIKKEKKKRKLDDDSTGKY